MKDKRNPVPVTQDATQNETPMQLLETAMQECGFGRFQIRVLFTALVSNVTNVLVSGNTPYLLPNAECDLNMNIYQKGILNAMVYVGMICSGFFGGFLTDTFGRKIFLIWGYCGIFLCTIIEGSSQRFETLLAAKYLEGFVFSAAFNAMLALVSELGHKNIRDRMMLGSSSFVAVAHSIIALMSWAILPQNWRFSFFDGAFVLNSWNIYLYVCGLWSLAASILYTFLPESPKYLVAHGRYGEALHILRNIYKENTGKPVESLTVKSFSTLQKPSNNSIQNLSKTSFAKQIVTGLADIKPLFRRPLGLYMALICTMQFMVMLAYNVLRLWYPQISTVIEHFTIKHQKTEDLCTMLDSYMIETSRMEINSTTLPQDCVPNRSGNETYINSIIMGCVCLVPYIIGGALVTRVGKKLLLLVSLSVCCACVVGLTWTVSSVQVVIMVSMTVALTQVCMSLMQTVVVEIFPTVSKSLAISLMMMTGRIGTLSGNILFPVLLAQGCVLPFFTIAGMLFCVAALSFLLPAAVKK